MNREILFRGKRLDNGEWVYGLLTVMWGQYHIINPEDENTSYPIDPATVGQYTGLTDKNGVKIFEGDVIATHYKNAIKADFIEYVVFHKGRFCATPDDEHIWAGLADGIKHPPRGENVYMEWCEVVSNIHDNSSLLEEA